MFARRFVFSFALALALAAIILLPGLITLTAQAQGPDEAAAACTADFKQKWMPKGNCKTNPANHFLGTRDNQPLVFKTNAAERLRIAANGNVGIGTSTPGFKLDVADRIRVRQGSAPSAGIWLHQKTPNNDRAFLGMADDTHVGIYGNTGAGWSLIADTTSGNVGIGTYAPSERLTVQTVTGDYGLVHTDGTAVVGTWVGTGSSGAEGGWFGTKSNHPLNFFTGNSEPRLTIGTNGNISIGSSGLDSTCCAKVSIRVPDATPINHALDIVNGSGHTVLEVANDGTLRVGKLREYDSANTYEYVCYDKSFGRLSHCSATAQAVPDKDRPGDDKQLQEQVDALGQENQALKQQLTSLEARLAALESAMQMQVVSSSERPAVVVSR